MTRLLVLNGSLRGSSGNTEALLSLVDATAEPGVEVDRVTLAEYTGTVEELVARLVASDALLFATGVYWSSWGSPLQRFLEVMTGYELTPAFFGKPASVIVNADSVGAAEVAHRLLGALNHLGCWSPPLASMVITRVSLQVRGCAGFEDVFQPEDIRVLVANLCTAARMPRGDFTSWGVARTPPVTGPYPSSGPLLAGLERFAP